MELTRPGHLLRAPGGQEPSLRDPPTPLCSGVFSDDCTPTVSGPHTAPPAAIQPSSSGLGPLTMASAGLREESRLPGVEFAFSDHWEGAPTLRHLWVAAAHPLPTEHWVVCCQPLLPRPPDPHPVTLLPEDPRPTPPCRAGAVTVPGGNALSPWEAAWMHM